MNKLTWDCKACNKERDDRDIFVFKHPILDDLKIIGWRHFNYCNDSITCYIKASRLEYCKEGLIDDKDD